MYNNSLCYLDILRVNYRPEYLRQTFRGMASRNRNNAIKLLNDNRLQFPTLFLLIPEIDALNLYEELIPRSIAAIRLCAKKQNQNELYERLSRLLPEDSSKSHEALKWMLVTGLNWDGPSKLYDSYDAAIDAAAALLIVTYKDTDVLPGIAKLIFRRNRKGLFIHDLVWCFFKSCDLSAPKLVAEYLRSGNLKDVELACGLLHIPMPADAHRQSVRNKLYSQYMSWFNNNLPYLCFSGEFYHRTSEPNPVYEDMEAKYLGKRIFPKDGRPIDPLTSDEENSLVRFRTLKNDEAAAVASYSAKIKNTDGGAWKQWMKGNLAQQVSTAKSETAVV
ncbi:hypothetical protein SDC9_58094 [bioreactor metagenome]|uniref:Uncharacterized protein n=1 Tax=bioreactor metagenome TaxID=1076179 RepID=A0A644XC25_9ZZZZ